MGTPDFSVPALKTLAQSPEFEIPLVVTQPDRPKGRGKKLAASPVKSAAIDLGLPLFQPERLNTPEAVEVLADIEPDFFVVAAFGQILSRQVLDIPNFYPVNIHASLLPKYRGASPIQAAILNMDKTSGITTMVMAQKMDAGDILLTAETPISRDDTAQDLHDRLSVMGADLIVPTLKGILDNTLTPQPQDETAATYVKLLKKEDGRINWDESSAATAARIRAMTPWPGAFTRLSDQTIKIFKAMDIPDCPKTPPGTLYQCNEKGIHVACGQGSLVILELMGRSGKRLTAAEYLRGHRMTPPLQFDVR